ncbi:sensor histidine kinase [Actinomadura flavalba]|uniref:sensor histidine kinase n=1 Tax=Actinomadura flavalba TaxID=1120938 RepID=UPI00036CEA4D|nr:sensor histidine kinase [Actinomadura flavalba]
MSDAFTHLLLPYEGVDEFVGATLPFLRDGLAAGDRIVVVTGLATRTLLAGELGGDAGRVEFADAATWYDHPARTLARAVADADELGAHGRRLRLLTEPAWTRRAPREVGEWQRVEALANAAFARTGASIMCPYAVKRLPAGVVADARRTHPGTARGPCTKVNPGFVEPRAYCVRRDREPLPPRPEGTRVLQLHSPDLFWIRAWIADGARGARLPEDATQRLLVAATEVITNALRHGAPPITLSLWPQPGEVVCEVTDGGRWPDGSWFGQLPPPPGRPGLLGLWAVRLLCSDVRIRTGDTGTVVRMHVDVPAHGNTG